MIGITIGVLIWATAAVLGLAIIFATMPIIQGIVMMLGGSYLVYLGIKMAKVKPMRFLMKSRMQIHQINRL